MMNHKLTKLILAIIAIAVLATTSTARDREPQAKAPLLHGSILLTPAVAEYTFKQGYPTGDTPENMYRHVDLQRAIKAYTTFLVNLTNLTIPTY